MPTASEPAIPRPEDGGLLRLRLDLGYDGSGFAGWARQPGRRTVQEVLESALATVLRLDQVSCTCAGRTDAGVHARGQVVHTDVPSAAHSAVAEHLEQRLAGVLPADVGLRAVTVAPDGFDARFGALSRRYAYRVCDAPYGVDPLRRHDVLWHRRHLDVQAMNEASAPLLGEHDFAAFCRRRRQSTATTVRTLRRLDWSRLASEGAELVVASIEADAFCHNMVRSLVGALLAVGDGRRPVGWPAAVLAGRARVPDVHVVPPHGLTLEEVRYPPAGELAARAADARRLREVPT